MFIDELQAINVGSATNEVKSFTGTAVRGDDTQQGRRRHREYVRRIVVIPMG